MEGHQPGSHQRMLETKQNIETVPDVRYIQQLEVDKIMKQYNLSHYGTIDQASLEEMFDCKHQMTHHKQEQYLRDKLRH